MGKLSYLKQGVEEKRQTSWNFLIKLYHKQHVSYRIIFCM